MKELFLVFCIALIFPVCMWVDYILYCKAMPRMAAKKEDWDEWYSHIPIARSGLYMWWKMRRTRARLKQMRR